MGNNCQNKSEEHTRLVNDILVELSKRPCIRVWPVIVGKFRLLRDPDIIVSVGRAGQADISGLITVHGVGRRLEIEVKTGNATQTKEQKNFQAMILKLGGEYIVARSIEDATTFCDELQNDQC